MDAPEPRVRRAIAAGLGELTGDETAGRALAAELQAGDRSVFVEAEVALSLGRTRSPLAVELLPPLVDRPSFQAVLASRAIEGLGKTGDERAFPLIRGAWRAGAPFPAPARRGRGAGRAGARHRPGPRRARGDRRAAARPRLPGPHRGSDGARAAGPGRRHPRLRSALAGELDGRTKRRLNDAIRDLEDGARPAEEARRLHDEVERLRGETAKLRERMDRLEPRLGAAARPGTTAPQGQAPPPLTPPAPGAPAPSGDKALGL